MENNTEMILEGMIAIQENELEMLYEAVLETQWKDVDQSKLKELFNKVDAKNSDLKPIKSESNLTDVEKGKLAKKLAIKKWFRFNTLAELGHQTKHELKGMGAGAAVGGTIGAAASKLKGGNVKGGAAAGAAMGAYAGDLASNIMTTVNQFGSYSVPETTAGRLFFRQYKKLDGKMRIIYIVIPYKKANGNIVIKKVTVGKNILKK